MGIHRDTSKLGKLYAKAQDGLHSSSFTAEVSEPAVTASIRSSQRINQISTEIQNVAASANAFAATTSDIVTEARNQLEKQMDAAVTANEEYLAEQLKLLNAEMDEQDEMISSTVATMMEQTEQKLEDASEGVDNIKKYMTGVKKCGKDGHIWNSEKEECQTPEVAPDANAPNIYYNKWRSDDGRDCGWLEGGRELNFVKHEDDTHIRVFYYDNVRVHGHTAHVSYNVMICKDGNCRHCQQPGKIMLWRWSGHQHNWWMNDHTGATAFGLCKKTDAFELTAGTYSIRILLENCRYDTHTGSNQMGSLMVDEVYVQ